MYLAISFKDNPKRIGTICLWNISDDGTNAEIGFELLPDYQGKSLMNEVIPIVIQHGFDVLRMQSITGEVDPKNVKSIKPMENNGFIFKEKLKKTSIYSRHYDQIEVNKFLFIVSFSPPP